MNDEVKERSMEALEKLYQGEQLPERLAAQYYIASCLKASDDKDVFLLTHLQNGGQFILKRGRGKQAELLAQEYRLLSSVKFSFVPQAVCFFEDERQCWLVREYAPGETLEQLVERKGPLSPCEALNAIETICTHLQMLHGHTPPLIHRDIKPQNIVRTDAGDYHLIDIDAMRDYKPDAQYDTVFLGTRETAAPEQFGYQQTSAKSDIYSIGVLLLYLLTGEYVLNDCNLKMAPKPLRTVIRKCTAFDPKRRYHSAAALLRELKYVKRFQQPRRVLFPVVTACALILAVIVVGLGNMVSNALRTERPVLFQNQRLETAARQILGKNATAPLYPSELGQITTLILSEDESFTQWDEYQDYHGIHEYDTPKSPAPPMSLEDLRYFTGLTSLALEKQNISDLSALAALPLTRLSLSWNQVTDLTPLSACSELRVLWLSHNPITDLSPLAGLTTLSDFDITDTSVTSLEPLKNAPLQRLLCLNTGLSYHTFLPDYPGLSDLRLTGADEETIRYISGLTNLEVLGLFDSDVTALAQVGSMPRLSTLDLTGCVGLNSLEGIESYPALLYLSVSGTGVRDLTPVVALPRLDALEVIGVPIEDYSFLSDCPRLHTLILHDGARARAASQISPSGIEIIGVDF